MSQRLFTCLLLILLAVFVSAQEEEPQIIQISGFVYAQDSTEAVPYAHVINKTKRRGTVASLDGFFSVLAKPGDTLQFTAIGYQKKLFATPEQESDRLYLLIFMDRDTIMLRETVVYPFDKNTFRQYFLRNEIPTVLDTMPVAVDALPAIIPPPPLSPDGKPLPTGVVMRGVVSKPLAAIMDFVHERRKKPKVARTLPSWE